MTRNLFIPSKLRVGFQKRQGTFTGKLAYVIYYDEKGKIRKEKSWTTWSDAKITALEIDNKPQNGYLFNKGIKRDGYHWGSGRSVIRVYDPRDFEFEISVDNLIGILMHSDVSKRDIVEECIFAWHGADLVLLPVNSEEYTQSLEYTAKQASKVSARDLVVGRQYAMKKESTILTYIGRYEWFHWGSDYNLGYDTVITKHTSKGKKHLFMDPQGNFDPTPVARLSAEVNSEPVEDIATHIENFFSSINSQPSLGYKIVNEPQPIVESWRTQYLYKVLSGGVVLSISATGFFNGYAEGKPVNLKDINVYVAAYQDKHDEAGLRFDRIDYGRSSGYHHYSAPKNLPSNNHHAQAISMLKTAVADLHFDSTAITNEQIETAIRHAGFGELSLTLSNGKRTLITL